jgi:two-component system phosphate regulon sensor histidine kinase PhoR
MFKVGKNTGESFLVSHELKTPLFTVQGYISTLLDGAMEDKVIRKKYLKRAEKASSDLYRRGFRYDNQT